ncbi:YebG family protein [Neptuniibacter sp. QD37_11]|uniref:YebG family protein n=1 Tax=Neptuniibacter sp. QD37_11 TaxID=3398209 RepID=UPI0039F46268
MPIINVYRVVDRKGNLIGEYMDKKVADIVDKRMDAQYDLADKMQELGLELTEQQCEALGGWMVEAREDIKDVLKGLKDIPDDEDAGASDKPELAAAS